MSKVIQFDKMFCDKQMKCQEIHLTLSLAQSRPHFFSISQHPPVSFFIDNLESANSYRIVLFAVNPKGRSEPTVIDDIKFEGVAKFTGTIQRQRPVIVPFLSLGQIPSSPLCTFLVSR